MLEKNSPNLIFTKFSQYNLYLLNVLVELIQVIRNSGRSPNRKLEKMIVDAIALTL